ACSCRNPHSQRKTARSNTVKPVRIGVGGPVGAGKTQLIERITRALADEFSMAAITNDIYTIEDAKILAADGVLPLDRIIGIETGGCPHTAIREDTSMNEAAIKELKRRHEDLDIVFVESGGDNLSATFSPELVDFSMYIIDVAQGEKIPRKAGQGMIKSDFFVINKTDLAPYVGADLSVMEKDSLEFRGDKPFSFTNLKTDDGLDAILNGIPKDVMMAVLAQGPLAMHPTIPSASCAWLSKGALVGRLLRNNTFRVPCPYCVPTISTIRARFPTRL